MLRGVQRFHQELKRSRSGEGGGMAGWPHVETDHPTEQERTGEQRQEGLEEERPGLSDLAQVVGFSLGGEDVERDHLRDGEQGRRQHERRTAQPKKARGSHPYTSIISKDTSPGGPGRGKDKTGAHSG